MAESIDIQSLLSMLAGEASRLQSENKRLHEINNYLERALEERKVDMARMEMELKAAQEDTHA